MFTKFLLLLLFTIAIIGAHADLDNGEHEESQSTIDDDAAELAALQKKYITRSPYESIRGDRITRCRVVEECCPKQRKHLFHLVNDAKFVVTCVGTLGSPLFNSLSSKCRSLMQHSNNIRNSNEYTTLFQSAYAGFQTINHQFAVFRTKMEAVCSAAELSAFYCEPENSGLFHSCAKKVLTLVERQTDREGYNEYLRQLKESYGTIIQRITSHFPYVR